MKLETFSFMIAVSTLALSVCDAKSEEWIKPQQETAIEKSVPGTDLPQKIAACWNVGSLSTEASGMSVLVKVHFDSNGLPQPGGITFEGYRDGSEVAAVQAFEAARRAILRCGRDGYVLPEVARIARSVELVFSPSGMRLR